jgi:hypothetical protein
MWYVVIYGGFLIAFLVGYRFGLTVAWGQRMERHYEIEEALRRRKESES